ncbi:hypothetical protein [Gimesia algae]|uniref:Uncharacterized protein n=1 Tax=Gimesia algae TaxID=2527971 RepID=A0A517VMQ9_9PLAN|nr:hypothetical protein [Gimesia algae]QDT94311.1 hypothetical protein Pan161_60070 [Gimesia algae]
MIFFKKQDPNRARLIALLDQIREAESPVGWERVVSMAVGGLTDLGFSKNSPHLLVISSQGRGVIDCQTGEKVARDYDETGDWFKPQQLLCQGIGPLASEWIQTCGINGGGLPWGNQFGESIEMHSPDWPVYDLYFCSDCQSPLIAGAASRCCKIDSEHLRACGFSWCGHFLVSANSSDLTLWKKQNSDTPTA